MRGNHRQPAYIEPGTRFGYFTVVREAPRRKYLRYMLCRCICGEEREVFLGNLKARKSLSCGCAHNFGEASRALILEKRRAISEESDEGRICLTCNTWKPWKCFSNDSRRNRGKTSNCMECGRWRAVKANYGITREEWEKLLRAQGGLCALCGEPESTDQRKLAIDHDHGCCGPTKACRACIRGLLCSVCNRLLGHIDGRPRLQGRFSDYLGQRPFAQ